MVRAMESAPHHPRAWAAIDLLRFACALMVVAHHYWAALPLAPVPTSEAMLAHTRLSAEWAGWTGFGWVGVELFFVISGYVIACSAIGTAPADFVRRRAQRLLPAAWICATLTFALLLALNAAAPVTLTLQWLRSMAFWPLGDQIDPSYWTLGVEVAFYALVAWRLRGGSSPERIERLAWWIGGASLAFWALLLATGQLESDWMKEGLARLLLLPHGVFFALGMFVHAWHRRGGDARLAGGIALLLAGAAVEIVAHGIDQTNHQGISGGTEVALAAFAIGVAVIAGCRRIQPWLGWSCGFSATLGLMTYPLYLIHQQLGAGMASLFGPGAMVPAVFVSIAIAWGVVRYGEPGIRGWIGTMFSRRRGPRPDSYPIASP